MTHPLSTMVDNDTIVVDAIITGKASAPRTPSTDEKAALAGTSGTPSVTNKFVTDGDSRNTNSRTPSAHASTHLPGGTDALTTAAPGTITPGDAAAAGSAASFARSDHKHAIAAFGTTSGTFCQGNDARLSGNVPTTRAINTTAPITGGGDLSADRTLAMAKSTASVDGYLAATDFTTFNAKVATTRQVLAGTGLTGGGDLSADRTLTVAYGTSSSTACVGNDSRLSDSRTPSAHATSHKSGGSDVILLDELGAPTDVATLNASTSTHGLLKKLDGTTSNFLRGDGAWAAPAGSGGSTIWSSEVAPASPSALDDEGTLTGWTTWDPGSFGTITTDNSWISISGSGNGGNRVCGVFKSALHTEFAAYVHIALLARFADTMTAGLFAAIGALSSSPGTTAFAGIEAFVSNATPNTQAYNATAYNGTFTRSGSLLGFPANYMRIRANGTTINCDASNDGRTWWFVSAPTIASNVGIVGLTLRTSTNAQSAIGLTKFFRYFGGAGTSGINATHIGGYL